MLSPSTICLSTGTFSPGRTTADIYLHLDNGHVLGAEIPDHARRFWNAIPSTCAWRLRSGRAPALLSQRPSKIKVMMTTAVSSHTCGMAAPGRRVPNQSGTKVMITL